MTHKKAAVLNVKTLHRLTFKHLLLDGTAVIGVGEALGTRLGHKWVTGTPDLPPQVGHWGQALKVVPLLFF